MQLSICVVVVDSFPGLPLVKEVQPRYKTLFRTELQQWRPRANRLTENPKE